MNAAISVGEETLSNKKYRLHLKNKELQLIISSKFLCISRKIDATSSRSLNPECRRQQGGRAKHERYLHELTLINIIVEKRLLNLVALWSMWGRTGTAMWGVLGIFTFDIKISRNLNAFNLAKHFWINRRDFWK